MKYVLLIACLAVLYTNSYAQYTDDLPTKERYMRIMFYNVENLFDTENDSVKRDDEFLPRGAKFWSKRKYYDKLHKIASVIASVGAWQNPEIVGLCEVENRKVLDDLCNKTGLRNLNYSIIHKESPDKRGIDVALLYQRKSFTPLFYKAINVHFEKSPNSTTRDILYVKGVTKNKDSLHIFINHWPSRWGGQMASEHRRISAAKTLRTTVDSIVSNDEYAKIIIMGDLNDYPDNKSVIGVLKAGVKFDNIENNKLYNLSAFIESAHNIGSHKHKGEWGVLDQIIVSGALLNSNKGVNTHKEDAYIFNADFLQIDDEAFTGKKNFRTYLGYRYQGGYSDHLPVFLDLHIADKE